MIGTVGGYERGVSATAKAVGHAASVGAATPTGQGRPRARARRPPLIPIGEEKVKRRLALPAHAPPQQSGDGPCAVPRRTAQRRSPRRTKTPEHIAPTLSPQ